MRARFVSVAFILGALALVFSAVGQQATRLAAAAAGEAADARGTWTVGSPIVTYWAGPPMSEAVAKQMADGGFNVVWCNEKDLDLLAKHRLRGMLHDPLLTPATIDTEDGRRRLDALVDRVRGHPAFYAYFVTDEPSAAAFPALGKLVAYLREKDPARLVYINLFPTYATNDQLGTKGDVATAYREYLRRYVGTVKPGLISYDHYQFDANRDGQQYFLNLAMVRRAAQEAKVPFLNIVQASSWQPGVRVPTPDETRYLVYTTLAYGAQGISYYVYTAPGHAGGIAGADGVPMPIYEPLGKLNREFLAVATELQPLRSLAVWHTAMTEPGCEPPPADATFRLDPPVPAGHPRGLLLATFGREADGQPTHALAVNLDYKAEVTTTLVGPKSLRRFDATAAKWGEPQGPRVELRLPPGGGALVRLAE